MTAAEVAGGRRCRSPLKFAESKRLAHCRDTSRPSHPSRLTPTARHDAAPEPKI